MMSDVRRWKNLWCGALAAAALSVGSPAAAQIGVPSPATKVAPAVSATAAPAPASDVSADSQAIRKAAQEFVAAFNKGDAAALAAPWTDNGEFQTESGATIVGRAAIQAAYAEYFKENPRSKVEIEVGAVKFPARDLAIEEGMLRTLPPAPMLPSSSRYSVLHVREGGVWKVAVCREFAVGRPQLQDLAWLVGEWKSGGKVVETSTKYEWNEARTLLRCKFSRTEGGKVVSSGTQTIYLDPQRGILRSQTFDEEGGRGESAWERDGDRWRLTTDSVLASGVATTSVEVVARLTPTTLLWRSIDRVVDGEPAPDADPVKLTLVPAAK